MVLAQLMLPSGRKLLLKDVRLTSTYAGLIDGVPSARLNDREVARLAQCAERTFSGLPLHVIPPPLRYPNSVRHDRPLGLHGRLPAVGCIGYFTSAEVNRPDDPVLLSTEFAVSELVVVWYQADASTLIGEDALPSLTSLPWDELAANTAVL